MDTLELIEKFDLILSDKGLAFEAVVIGGAALNLLGVVSRYTRDCDILDPKIPNSVLIAAQDFARAQCQFGHNLRDDWLKNGPDSLKEVLPVGWQNRLVALFNGEAIHFSTLGRSDLIKTKLFAFCDRGSDKLDCLLLKPSKIELEEALEWVQEQDLNPDWPQYVENCFSSLAEELGYGI